MALAALTYYAIERPIRRYANYRGSLAFFGGAMVVVGLFGVFVFKSSGLPDRPMIVLQAQINALFEGWNWKYIKNDVRQNRYPFEEARSYTVWFCIASKDAPPTVLLLGNSYANHLYPALAKTKQLSGNSVLSIGTCEPDERLADNPPAQTDPCFGTRQIHQQNLINNIIETSPSLKFVIFDSLRASDKEDYVAGIRRRIDLIEQRGISVIFLSPI